MKKVKVEVLPPGIASGAIETYAERYLSSKQMCVGEDKRTEKLHPWRRYEKKLRGG